MSALRPLLALAAVLLPAPALADVTARYAFRDGTLTIQAADNGDSRIQIEAASSMAFIRHAGVDYLAIRDRGGVERVARADAALASMVGALPAPGTTMMFTTTEHGTESIAGYSGIFYSFGPPGEKPLELVMSADPRLAPIGAVCRSLVELLIAVPGMPLDPAQLRKIFAAGAPLRIGPADSPPGDMVTLESVSTAPIDPARFALAGPVMDVEAFRAAILPPARETAPVNEAH